MPSGVGREPVSGYLPLTVPRQPRLWRQALDGEPVELLADECAREVC